MQRISLLIVAGSVVSALLFGVSGTANAGCAIAVGAGASGSDRTAIVAAYNRNGGEAVLGCPINDVHRWGDGRIQDLRKGAAESAVMLEDGRSRAFVVLGAIWATYAYREGGATGYLGYPRSDELGRASGVSRCRAVIQRFAAPGSPAGSQLVYHDNCPDAGTTFVVHGAIYNSWRLADRRHVTQGGVRSVLGVPLTNEFDWMGGRRQNFEGGYLHWTGGSKATRRFTADPAVNRFHEPLTGYLLTQDCGDFLTGFGYHLAEDAVPNNGTVKAAGKPVRSPGYGIVRFSGSVGGYGNAVVLEFAVPRVGGGAVSYVTMVFGHLKPTGLKAVGARVHRGTIIGKLGTRYENGGFSPHLHWGVKPGEYVGFSYPGYTQDPDDIRDWFDPGDYVAAPEEYDGSPRCSR